MPDAVGALRTVMTRCRASAHQLRAPFGGPIAPGVSVMGQSPQTLRPTAMENPRLLDEINERVRAVLAQSPAADLEKNLRAILTGLFSRLDLVTREEFDVQREVLARTRQKLVQLEAQVAELEGRLKRNGSGS